MPDAHERHDGRDGREGPEGPEGPDGRGGRDGRGGPDEQDAQVGRGAGRLLVAVYAVFALAASSRAAVQLATRFSEAPVAYLLSAVAAGVYVVATVALARGLRRLAFATVLFELVGVLVVGTFTVLDRGEFPDETVWSVYGAGYGFVPLVLPVLGLLRLRATR